VHKGDNIFGAVAGDKSFILGLTDLIYSLFFLELSNKDLRTNNSLNLYWLALCDSFPSGDSIELIYQVYCKEQSLLATWNSWRGSIHWYPIFVPNLII
jgi:hypothetical protein